MGTGGTSPGRHWGEEKLETAHMDESHPGVPWSCRDGTGVEGEKKVSAWPELLRDSCSAGPGPEGCCLRVVRLPGTPAPRESGCSAPPHFHVAPGSSGTYTIFYVSM